MWWGGRGVGWFQLGRSGRLAEFNARLLRNLWGKEHTEDFCSEAASAFDKITGFVCRFEGMEVFRV